jgi:hypothetical protein
VRRKLEKKSAACRIEALESRLFLSTVSWIASTGGQWSTAADWSSGVVPQAGDDVVINKAGNLTITLAGSTSVNSVTVTGDTLSVSGGTLSLAANSSVGPSGSLTLSSATLSLATGAALANSGSITVNPASQIDDSAAYSQTATGTLTLPSGTKTTGVGTNLLGNPGFESPTASGSTTVPNSWGQWGNAYVSTAYAHSGTQSLLEYGSNSGAYQSFAVSPGVSYSASVYALTPSSAKLTGSQGAFLQIVFLNASGGKISSPSAWITLLNSNSTAGTWINSTTSLTAPSTAATVDVYLQVGPYTGNSGTAGGSAYMDDIAFGPTAITSASVKATSVSNSGSISIGAGDTISDTGTFTQSAPGSLSILLGGPAAGLFYGSVSVTGAATLSGTFSASLVSGYSPNVNDGFTLLSYASETGNFTSDQLPSGSGYAFEPGVNPTYFGISAVSPSLSATINAASTAGTATSSLVGVNLAYWDDLLTTTQTQQMVEAAGLNLFRFPGGSASDDFHFNVAANYGDGSADTIPQFAQFISQVGGTGIVTTDYGSGSPQEAEAELAYLDGSPSDTTTIGTGIEWNDTAGAWQNVNWQTVGYWASLRAAKPLATNDGMNFLRIDQAAPFTNVTDWEIGNEEYGSWEDDHHGTAGPGGASTGSQHDPATYAAFAAAFAAFDASDNLLPVVKIGIDSGDPTGASDNNWTKSVVTDLYADGYVPGFISDHSYMQSPGTESDSFLLNDTVSDAGSILDWSTRYADYESILQGVLGAKSSSVKIMATEYNSNWGTEGKQMTSLVNGLFVADSIGSLMNAGYSGGVFWDLRNGWTTDGNNSSTLYGWREGGDEGILGTNGDNAPPSTGPYVAYPTYFAEQLASKIMQPGSTGLSATSNYAGLDVYSVEEPNGHLDLMVVNKNPDAQLTEQFNISGFTPSGAAQIWQYGEAQDNAQSQSTTGAASLANSSTMLSLSGNNFSYSFPAYSMTVIDLTAALPAWVGSTSTANWNPFSKTLTVTGATSIVSDPGTVLPTIMASGSSASITIGSTSSAQLHLGGLSLTDGASATVTSLGSARSLSNYRVLVIGSAGATTTPLFTLDSTSTLDLADNDMAILYGTATSPLTTVSAAISQAYDGGLWDKPGLTSSIARTEDGVTALGYGEASALGVTTFDGQTLGGNAVLLKYTLAGDTQLRGSVGIGDYDAILSNFGTTQGWTGGDFHYGGVVGIGDYDAGLANYGKSLASVLGSAASPAVASDSVLIADNAPVQQKTPPHNAARKSKTKSVPKLVRHEKRTTP